MNKDKIARRMAFMMAVVLCVPGMTGCRKTPVLEKIVYSDDASEVDYDRYQYEMENNAELDPDRQMSEDTENEQGDEQKKSSVKGDGNASTGHNSDLEYNAGSDVSTAGSTGTQSNPDATTTTPSGSGTQNQEATTSGNGGTSGTSGDSGSASGGEGEGSGDTPTEIPEPSQYTTPQQVFDANGEVIEVPTSSKRVAAVGAVAAYVEMLGGSERLVATSADFTESSLASQVFGESPTALWSGDGSSAVSDVQTLIAQQPQIVLMESGSGTLSTDQITELQNNGISVVTVPKLNTTENIESAESGAVTLIGQCLGDRSDTGGENAIQNAKDYISWRQGILKTVGDSCQRYSYEAVDYDNDRSNGGKVKYFTNNSNNACYSLYVNDWDDGASWTVFNSSKPNALSGTGAPAAKSGYSYSPLSYYMSLAGVCNTAASYDDFGTEREWYVNSLLKGAFVITITGTYTNYTSGEQNSPYLTRRNKKNNNTDFYQLGDQQFSKIIAASSYIKNKINSSPLMEYHNEIVKTGTGNFNGFTLEEQPQGSLITGSYEVLVNPHGAAAWDDGSPESPLESMWISTQFGGEISTDTLRNEIRSFYSKFYRTDLTDDQITAILNGI